MSDDQAAKKVQHLRQQSKAQVFNIWQRTCLGRIQCAHLQDQQKSWMIYDIVRCEFGQATADKVA